MADMSITERAAKLRRLGFGIAYKRAKERTGLSDAQLLGRDPEHAESRHRMWRDFYRGIEGQTPPTQLKIVADAVGYSTPRVHAAIMKYEDRHGQR